MSIQKASYIYAPGYGMFPIAWRGEIQETTRETHKEFVSSTGAVSVTNRLMKDARTWDINGEIPVVWYGRLSELIRNSARRGPYRLLTKQAARYNALPSQFVGPFTGQRKDEDFLPYDEWHGQELFTGWSPIPPDAKNVTVTAWANGVGNIGVEWLLNNSSDPHSPTVGAYESMPFETTGSRGQRIGAMFTVPNMLIESSDHIVGVRLKANHSTPMHLGRPALTFTNKIKPYSEPLGAEKVAFFIHQQTYGNIPLEDDYAMIAVTGRAVEITS